MDEDMNNAGVGTMITSLAWVSKGYAKPVLEGYEPSNKAMNKQGKITKKLLGDVSANKEVGKAVKEAE